MNAFLHWFTAPEWSQLVKTLLHSLWQGVLIAAVLALTMRRVVNPHWRYRLALLALVMIPASGILTWAALNSPHRSLPAPVAQPIPADAPPITTLSENSQTKLLSFNNRSPAPPPLSWTAWLALLWIVGTSAMLGRASVKLAGAERLRRSCLPLDNPQVTQLLAEARRAVGLIRRIRVAITDQLTSPAVVGMFVPTLILPLSLVTTLTPEQIRFILLHELAHIRRGDYLTNLFQLFIEAVLFFNPAVWWISHQVRREREACCDALAIGLSGAPTDYARTLVHVAENVLNPTPTPAVAFGDKRELSSLSDRVQRLLVPGYRPSLRLTWRAMLAAFALGTTVLVLSAEGTRAVVAQLADSSAKPPKPTTQINAMSLATSEPLSGSGSTFSQEFKLGEPPSPLGPRINARAAVGESPEMHQVKIRLESIRFDRVSCSNKPLSELFRELSELSQTLDKDGVGLRFNFRPFRYGSVPVTIDPPLENVTVFEILAAIQVTPQLGIGGLDVNGRVTLSPGASMVIEHYPIIQEQPPSPSESTNDQRPPNGSLSHPTQTSSAPVEISGLTERSRIEYDAAAGKTVATNGAVVRFKDQVLRADKVQFDQRNGNLTATGNVRVERSGLTNNSARVELNVYSNQPPTQSPARPASGGSSLTTNASGLSTRTFKVDPNTFGKALESITATPVTGTNITGAVRSFFSTLGVELTPPKGIYYNDRAGELVVRSTKEDLDVIEAAVAAANKPTPQVNIKVRFVELEGGNYNYGFDWYLGTIGSQSNTNTRLPVGNASTGTASNASPQSFTGILTDLQFRAVLKALDQRKGFSLLSEGEVTTLSGRQAQIQAVEMKTIVNAAALSDAKTNTATTNLYHSQVVPFGPTLDVIPTVSADGYTIQMTVIPTLTEFLGYDDSNVVYPSSAKKSKEAEILPLPRMRVRQASTSVVVWDGQTLVLGMGNDQTITKQPDGSIQKGKNPEARAKQLLVFITPSIIDQAGNRANPDAESLPTRSRPPK